MQEYLENLIGTCTLDPTDGLAIFWTTYVIESAEIEADLSKLELFGDLQSIILSSLKTVGFPLVASRINVFSFFNLEEKVPIPQSICYAYYPVSPEVFVFVISTKVISVDQILHLTEDLHVAVRDSLKYYEACKRSNMMRDETRKFLNQFVKLQDFPAYINYKIHTTPSTFINKIFDLRITPLQMIYERKRIQSSQPIFPIIEEQLTFENKAMKNSNIFPTIPPLFGEYLKGLIQANNEGIMKFGEISSREYNMLTPQIDGVIFELDKEQGEYLLFQGIHEPFGVGTTKIELRSIFSLGYSSKNLNHSFSGATCRNALNRILLKTKKMPSEQTKQLLSQELKREFGMHLVG
ncbi:MAG: hypothetical protein ACTSRW_15455 [Candidatus Helarchaeota archaeon]